MKPVYKKPRIKKVKPPKPVPAPKHPRPKRGDLKHIYKELISTSQEQRVNAMAKAMTWYDQVQAYVAYKQDIDYTQVNKHTWTTAQLRAMNHALSHRADGIKAKTLDTKEVKFEHAIKYYEVMGQSYKPPKISTFLRKLKSSKGTLQEHLGNMRKKYKKFILMLQDALDPGLTLKVDKLASRYRIGRHDVTIDRKWLAELKKLAHRKGLLSTVIELLPVLSEAMSSTLEEGTIDFEWRDRYDATLRLLTNVNNYAQQETAPRTIARRKKPKKEVV